MQGFDAVDDWLIGEDVMERVRIFAVLFAALMASMMPRMASASEAEIRQGRYMVLTGHCNNCHTIGFVAKQSNVPEKEWLLGNPVGFRTPAGTSYASNLRLTVQNFTEDEWAQYNKTARMQPPHPFWSIQPLSAQDLRAMHKYLKHLGPAGEMMPPFVPAGIEPVPPYEIRQIVR